MCSGPKSKPNGPSWIYDGQTGSNPPWTKTSFISTGWDPCCNQAFSPAISTDAPAQPLMKWRFFTNYCIVSGLPTIRPEPSAKARTSPRRAFCDQVPETAYRHKSSLHDHPMAASIWRR